MNFKTAIAQQVAKALRDHESGNGGQSRATLLEWFNQFRRKFPPDEVNELKLVLGVKGGVETTPFRELVPAGWMAEVLHLFREAESPASFFFLTSLSVLSQAIGRGVYIDRGTHKLGLDVSALLISPAGKGRRSTAADSVVYGLAAPAGLNIIADSFSYEAFGDALVECAGFQKPPKDRMIPGAKALIYAGEMAVLLGKGSYGDSIIPKLTDILGKTSRFEWRTVKRGGKLVFTGPCVNAILTTSPDWLVDNIPTIMFEGGTMSRFLTAVEEMPEQVVTWGRPLDVELQERLVRWLSKARSLKGVIGRPDKAAYDWYDAWYQDHSKRTLSGEIPDERMAPYYSRKHDHLLRVAALLQIASDGGLVLTVERFEQALRILEYLEAGIPGAYAKMALSPIAQAQNSVLNHLKRAGGAMEHSRLHRKVYRLTPLAHQFKMVMESLVELGSVKAVKSLSGRGTTYRVVKYLD